MDGLRALACVSVMTVHVWQIGPAGRSQLGAAWVYIEPIATIGLILFFTLSGFLLYRPFAAAIVGGRPLPSMRRYLRNRALRIVPAYWCALLLAAVTSTLAQPGNQNLGGGFDSVGTAVLNALLLQSYTPHTNLTGIPPAWSLSVEVVFYLVLPILAGAVALVLARRVRSRRIRLALLCAPPVALLFLGLAGKVVDHRLLGFSTSQATWGYVFQNSFLAKADLFSWGMVAAVITTSLGPAGLQRLPSRALAAAGCALIVFADLGNQSPLAALGCGVIVLWVAAAFTRERTAVAGAAPGVPAGDLRRGCVLQRVPPALAGRAVAARPRPCGPRLARRVCQPRERRAPNGRDRIDLLPVRRVAGDAPQDPDAERSIARPGTRSHVIAIAAKRRREHRRQPADAGRAADQRGRGRTHSRRARPRPRGTALVVRVGPPPARDAWYVAGRHVLGGEQPGPDAEPAAPGAAAGHSSASRADRRPRGRAGGRLRRRPGPVQVSAAISLLASPAILLWIYGLAVLQGIQDFRALNLCRLIFPPLNAAFLIGLWISGIGDLVLVTAIWVSLYLLSAVVTVAVARRRIARLPDTEPGALPANRELAVFGAKALLGSASPLTQFQLDQTIVGLFISQVALGIYVVAVAFTNLPRFIAQSIGLVAYPHVAAARDGRQRDRATLRFVAVTVVLCGAVVAATELALPFLVQHLFGRAVRAGG